MRFPFTVRGTFSADRLLPLPEKRTMNFGNSVAFRLIRNSSPSDCTSTVEHQFTTGGRNS